jgi:hypothetical protein
VSVTSPAAMRASRSSDRHLARTGATEDREENACSIGWVATQLYILTRVASNTFGETATLCTNASASASRSRASARARGCSTPKAARRFGLLGVGAGCGHRQGRAQNDERSKSVRLLHDRSNASSQRDRGPRRGPEGSLARLRRPRTYSTAKTPSAGLVYALTKRRRASQSCYRAATISSRRAGFQRVSSSGFFLSGEGLESGETLGDSPPAPFGTKKSEVQILSPRPSSYQQLKLAFGRALRGPFFAGRYPAVHPSRIGPYPDAGEGGAQVLDQRIRAAAQQSDPFQRELAREHPETAEAEAYPATSTTRLAQCPRPRLRFRACGTQSRIDDGAQRRIPKGGLHLIPAIRSPARQPTHLLP